MNTRVGCIAHWQARMASLAPPPSHSPEASLDDEDDADDDVAISSDDDKMAISQWLALCHLWQKREVVLDLRLVLYLGRELV